MRNAEALLLVNDDEAEAFELDRLCEHGVRADVARLCAMWSEVLAQHSGPFLFDQFTVADAYFAPVCTRMRTYALPMPPQVEGYVDRVMALAGVRAWVEGALGEKDFLDFEEPYRLSR
jgi:glutathione S-transferase